MRSAELHIMTFKELRKMQVLLKSTNKLSFYPHSQLSHGEIVITIINTIYTHALITKDAKECV